MEVLPMVSNKNWLGIRSYAQYNWINICNLNGDKLFIAYFKWKKQNDILQLKDQLIEFQKYFEE